MPHERFVAGDLAAGNRAPNAQGGVDLRGAIRGKALGGLLLHMASPLAKDDAVGLADVGVVHVEHDVAPRPRLPAVEGRHLAREHQAGILLLARLVDSPARVRHRLEDIAWEQVLVKLAAGLLSDAAARELFPGFPDPEKVLVGAFRQFLHAEKLALPAEERGVAVFPAKPVEQVGYAAVVSLRGVEAAGRNRDRAFAAHVVARRVPAVFRLRAHEGERHGKLPIDQVLQRAGQPEVVQREAPGNDVGPQNLLDDTLHVVADAALPWRLAPAGEASPAGLDFKRADAQGLDCGRLPVGVFFLGGDALQESAGQTPGIASLAFRAAVDCQDSHFALLSSAAQCSAQSMCICRLLLPKSAVIFQYGLWSSRPSSPSN